MAGSVSVIDAATVQPKSSTMFTVYVPAHRLSTVCVVSPVDQV